MPYDTDGAISQLVVDRANWGEEEQVRVQISEEIHPGVVVEDEQRQRGRAREIVFDRWAILLGRKQMVVAVFEFLERDCMDPWRGRARQRLAASQRHAE